MNAAKDRIRTSLRDAIIAAFTPNVVSSQGHWYARMLHNSGPVGTGHGETALNDAFSLY